LSIEAVAPGTGSHARPVAAPPAGGDGTGALLSLRGLRKRFGALVALDDVSLDIARSEIHCLLGENGAGKSTLCNLIFGVHAPDAGEMVLDGRPHRPGGPRDALAQGIAMVHQHFSLVSDLTVVDNLLLGQARGVLDRAACAQRVAALADEYGLAIAPRARIADLSVGERQRVEIIKCLMRSPRLLVLDEPTAVLLPDEIRALLAVCERVAAGGCSVVLVTHKLAEVERAAHRATVLRLGRVVARSDAPARDMRALVRAMIQRDLSGLGAMAGAALGTDAVATAAAADAGAAARTITRRPSAAVVLDVEDLVMHDAGGVVALDHVGLAVHEGEILGIAGVEGNGQSELAAVLSGMTVAASGRYRVGAHDLFGRPPKAVTRAGVGVVPEDRHRVGCVPTMPLAENLFLDRLHEFRRFGLLDRRALLAKAAASMREFDVRASGADQPFERLSGGNQQKAVLARELTVPGLRLLIAAQPTRGLDVGAVEAVYGYIRRACERGLAVLLISSELDELLAMCHRIAVMYRGRIMGECDARPDERARIGAWMAGHAA